MSKKININPEFFKLKGRSALHKKKKIKPIINSKTLKPNDIKKKLIAKIKEHQKREKEKLLEEKKRMKKNLKMILRKLFHILKVLKKKENIGGH